MDVIGIVLAAGQGERMRVKVRKPYLTLSEHPILFHTLRNFLTCTLIDYTYLVVAPSDIERCKEIVEHFQKIQIVEGGKERQDSVYNALKKISKADIIVIHDGVRPFVEDSLVEKVINQASKHGAAIVAVPMVDTVKVVEGGVVKRTLPRSILWSAQTPQAFKFELLKACYKEAYKCGYYATDDSELVERSGVKPKLVMGSRKNIKITTQEDLVVAEAILQGRHSDLRVGFGYDIHPLVEGRDLILGGVKIPFREGLHGHSDADVLVHAIIDAILGALGEGDIGRRFGVNHPDREGVSSLLLLEEITELLRDRNTRVGNVDSSIVCQKPKLAPHIPLMREKVSHILGVEESKVNIKATTSQGLNSIGEGRGISAYAVVTLL
jgi:2-C-methyl-D-erythritol 4-phosphate cytidylyltransferase/2-C-methyl-D-erythritol 2,4-cyclodiphosphate synthase